MSSTTVIGHLWNRFMLFEEDLGSDILYRNHGHFLISSVSGC